MIIQVIVVLNRTVVLTLIDLSITADIFRVKVGCIASVGNIKIWYMEENKTDAPSLQDTLTFE